MGEESLITDEMKDKLNMKFGPVVYEVEKWWLKKFAEAIDDPNPRWKEVAPPTFPTALLLEELENTVNTLNPLLAAGVNAGNELEYYQPIRLGDVITVTGKIVDLREREGRLGKMLITTSELSYTNQNGEVAARCRNTNIRY